MYSQTTWPSCVTSNRRPKMPSQISVLPLARRCAPEMYGLKNSNSAGSVYCQTISLVRGSTSRTREKVSGRSRRWVPLPKFRILPLGQVGGERSQAQQQYVAVPELARVVVMVRVAHLP